MKRRYRGNFSGEFGRRPRLARRFARRRDAIAAKRRPDHPLRWRERGSGLVRGVGKGRRCVESLAQGAIVALPFRIRERRVLALNIGGLEAKLESLPGIRSVAGNDARRRRQQGLHGHRQREQQNAQPTAPHAGSRRYKFPKGEPSRSPLAQYYRNLGRQQVFSLRLGDKG